jgi:hypothetical protein
MFAKLLTSPISDVICRIDACYGNWRALRCRQRHLQDACQDTHQSKIEFEKGKSAIAVPSRDKIASVIDTLITAVRNDEHLARAKKPPAVPKSKKAAA